MINTTLLWLLALPVILGIIVWVCRRHHQQCYVPVGLFILVSTLVICMGFFISKGSKTWDTEIWNGKVVAKDRQHGNYQRSYDCNCRSVSTRNSDGTTSTRRECDTCYEDRYTVKWQCDTTVGQYTIKSLDEGSRSVYQTPDPRRYAEIQVGDPASKKSTYVNYIQAVPNSLFTAASGDLKKKFEKLIPEYPDQVYDFYKLNRFLTPGVKVNDKQDWNDALSMGLRDLGPKKQVNAIIVIANTNDVNYEYALRDAWEGANKNDVVLIIGSTEYPKIDFVRVLSWTKSESFKIQLRDEVMDKGVIDISIVNTMLTHIDKNFQRREMKEFQYLDGEIDPPEWLVIFLVVLVIGGAGALYFFIPKWTTPAFGKTRRFR